MGSPLALSRAARERLGTDAPDRLVDALAALVGSAVEPAALEALIETARRAHRDEPPQALETQDGQRLLVGPGDQPGQLMAAVVAAPSTAAPGAPTAEQIAGVSHELSNALGAITGWARLARGGHRVDEALELIEKSAQSAWSAGRHVLSALSANGGSEPEAPTPMDLGAFVVDVARLLEPKAAKNHVRVRHHVEAPAPVMATRGALWTLVWNLAANGIEAMGHGGTLDLRVSAGGERVRLSVSDSGPGMPEALQARIFDRFFTTRTEGSGVGLAMVKDTVESLGGEITLRSKEGFGSRFEVTLPRAASNELPRRVSGVFRSEPPVGRVLLVEDDTALREFVATTLDLHGIPVVAVGSGREAAEQAGPFQVAMVDLLLPDCRGDELIASLRAQDAVHTAVLLSGAEMPENVRDAGRPDAVVRKPFDIDQLLERLRELMQNDGQAARDPSRLSSTESSP